MRIIKQALGIISVSVGASACVAVAVAGTTSGSVIGAGPDWLHASTDNPLAAAEVTVTASDRSGDGTQLTLDVRGIDSPAGAVLGAHLHEAPCGVAAPSSGPHYGHPDAHRPLRQRELWLDLRVNGNGGATATATRDWSVDDRATRSVVIHAAGTDRETGAAGTRLACTDLDA